MRRLHRPCARKHGGLKMKEACSLGPGWRVLLHQGPNTRQSSATERHTLLGTEGQGEEPLRGRKRCLVCECVSTRVHTSSSTPLCVGGGSYSYPREGKATLETPIVHLQLNSSDSQMQVFSLQGTGDPKTHNWPNLLTRDP